MARAHYRDHIFLNSGGVPTLVSGATVHVYQPGTTTPITQTMFDSLAGSGTKSNPLTSDSNGLIEFWLAGPETIDLAVDAGTTYAAQTVEGIAVAFDGGP